MKRNSLKGQPKYQLMFFTLVMSILFIIQFGISWAGTRLVSPIPEVATPFSQIELSKLTWQAIRGFNSDWTTGLPEGAVTLPQPVFPISLNGLFSTPTGSGLHEYTLSTSFPLTSDTARMHLALGLPELGENWAVYLNGKLLRSEIYLDSTGQHIVERRSEQSVVIALPNEMLKPGSNLLVFRMIGNAFITPFFTGWAPGFPLVDGYVIDRASNLQIQESKRDALAMVQIGAYLVFGMYMLLFYASRYEEIANLYLALFLLAFGAGWQFLNSPFVFRLYPDTSLITRLSYVTVIFSGILAPAIWHFLFPKQSAPLVVRIAIAYVIVVVCCLLTVPFEWIEIFLRSFLIVMGLLILVVFWILRKAWQARSSDIGKVSILVVLGALMIIWDLVDVQLIHTGWLTTPYLSFLFSGLFSIVIIQRYRRLSSERERIQQELTIRNQELEKSQGALESQVQQRTTELRKEVARREQAQQEAENPAIEADTLREASAAMIETLDLQEIVERILEQLRRVVPYDSASVQLVSADGNSSLVIGANGFINKDSVIGKKILLDKNDPTTQVYLTCNACLITNMAEEHLQIEHPDFEIQSWLCVPLIYHEKVIGLLTLDSSQANHFNERDASLVTTFSRPVALALHNAQVYDQVRRGAEELSMFYDIGLNINAGLDMNSLLEKLYSAACRLAQVDCFYIALFNEEAQQATFPFFIDNGKHKNLSPHSFANNSTSMTMWIIRNKKTLHFADTFQIPDHLGVTFIRTGGNLARSYVGVPLIARDHVLGVISLQSYSVNAYTETHLRLFETLATQAVIAIENSNLYSQAQKALDQRQQVEAKLSQANQRLTTQITEIQKLQENLREQAIRDSLTGLFNRRFMEETFTQELIRSARENRRIGVIILDIDKFKTINDRFGHEAGDASLVSLAKVLSGRLRASDTVCRYGGEEFLLILPGSSLEVTRRRAEELRQAVEGMTVPYTVDSLKITISLGIAAFPEHGREMDALIRQADNNLYQAKNSGRNRVAG